MPGEKFLAADANLHPDNQDKLRSASAAEYRRILDEVIEEFGDVPAAKLHRRDLREFLEKKAADTPFMANPIHAVVRRVYNWAKTKEWVKKNPCDGLERPGGKESERERVLDTDEIRSVWAAIEQERPIMAAYFKLLFLTGVRRSEARTACWANIDLEQRLWCIPVEKSKNKMARQLPLSDQALSLLGMLRPLTGHTEHVFIGPNGRALTTPQKAKEPIEERSKVSFRIHDIRRTVAIQLAAIGVPSDTISAILNHKVGGGSRRLESTCAMSALRRSAPPSTSGRATSSRSLPGRRTAVPVLSTQSYVLPRFARSSPVSLLDPRYPMLLSLTCELHGATKVSTLMPQETRPR